MTYLRTISWLVICAAFTLGTGQAQDRFTVTGTPIPPDLLAQNYGRLPKGIGAYDLSICNVTDVKHSLVSSEVFQALASSKPPLAPLGRQVILAGILAGQNHSTGNILRITLASVTGVLAILNASKLRLPSAFGTSAAVASLSGQLLLSNFSPLLTSNQVVRFEREVLEPALVLDSGSCVERTVFTLSNKSLKAPIDGLSFHVH